MGTVIYLKRRHARTFSRRSAKLVSSSDVTQADRAFSVSRMRAHHSDGIQLRCHHLVTVPAVAPISDASASRAPCASFGPHNSMTDRNDVISIDAFLGQFVLKSKSFLSLDGGISLGQNVPMVEVDEKDAYRLAFIGRVKLARASTGMKQWQVALAMGLEQDDYKHFEQLGPKGRLIPHHMITRFCFACHVDPTWLLTGHGQMKGAPAPREIETKQQPAAPRAKPKRRTAA